MHLTRRKSFGCFHNQNEMVTLRRFSILNGFEVEKKHDYMQSDENLIILVRASFSPVNKGHINGIVFFFEFESPKFFQLFLFSGDPRRKKFIFRKN